ncbi:unnamed protein product [Clavelina lepadiformis]|uniref:NAD(P)H oxidase (H2O2-forming) n=1 Tax=Clavelina lepadiformis TaxID=159417 RepID=A0ABP0H279_CLALP
MNTQEICLAKGIRFWKNSLQTVVVLLIASCVVTGTNKNARFDGWYNNLDHPDWGTPGLGLSRISPATFEDGVHVPRYKNLPNARMVSHALMKTDARIPSPSGKSVFFAFFGQHIGDDMADTRRVTCPNEYVNVEIPSDEDGNATIDGNIIPIYRSRFLPNTGTSTNSPRVLSNEVTAWLDGSVIYGVSQSWSEHLRSFKDGKLREEKGSPGIPSFNRNDLPLINPTIDSGRPPQARNKEELLSFGNPRGNENPFLMSVGIIWFRWHNYMAERFRNQNPDWPDQKIFEMARRWTVATYQKVVMYDWLPIMAGRGLEPYNGYNHHLDPSVSAEFTIAAMRIGHSLVPRAVVLLEQNCSTIDPLPEAYVDSAGEPALRLCNTFWQLQDAISKHGIDSIVLGMTSQAAEQTDASVVEDLSEFLYGYLKRTRTDLETITIDRGRDAGLSPYNQARVAYGLDPVSNFTQINPNLPQIVIDRLRQVYNDRLDLVEFSQGHAGSDRFWFENTENGLFNATELEEIRNTTMRDVITAVTSLQTSNLQENIFNVADSVCRPMEIPKAMFRKPCIPNKGIDFFEGYYGKFAGILILLLLFPAISYFVMCVLAWKRQNDMAVIKKRMADKQALKASLKKKRTSSQSSEDGKVFSAFEIEGKEKSRRVLIVLEGSCIKILSVAGTELRRICMKNFKKSYLFLSRNKKKDLMVIRVPKEYDVVLRFVDVEERQAGLQQVKNFMTKNDLQLETFEMEEKALKVEAITKEARQEILESFFRRIFAEALQLEDLSFEKGKNKTMEIAECELTQMELAETMGMKADSLFVKQMFQLADVDKSGYLSFREFADLIILLMNGSPEQKAKMLFDMYDLDHSGEINREESHDMIRSFLEMAGAKLSQEEVSKAVDTIFREAGIEDQDCLTLKDFQYVMLKEHRDSFAKAQLSLPGVTRSIRKKMAINQTQNTPQMQRQLTQMQESGNTQVNGSKEDGLRKRKKSGGDTDKQGEPYVDAVVDPEDKTFFGRRWKSLRRSIENYRRHILCMVIFYGITIALMVERATYYAFGAEHIGIRRVTEWGIIISRSTAAAISFHYSFILLTMCRNLITFCRETFLNNFIPFDSAVAFHKQIAYVAVVEALLHALGHISNVYHFSIHPLPVLACLFPKILVDDGSDVPRSIVWWFFESIPGVTGILLLLTLSIIYIFAKQFSRRYCFRAFWITHHLYSLLYVLIIFHGSMGVVQSPAFHFYLVVPAAMFTIDKLITISRSKIQISVVKAEPLPSGVLNLVFKRPTAFDYKSGQWVRIASLALGSNEYHPFTLTSAPHEKHLSLHIRSAGPWTTNLRNLYQSAIERNEKFPNLYLDGPFGEGHQDWYKYEVSVLVGAGIGVTPFASIIKDIVHRSTTHKGFQITCKKVYFIWVTRTQRHFEWLTDIIKDLEETEGGDLVSTHIYITQFSNKFDLRTTMLYICERYFQKVANKSMFTGLKAVTHFGRPQFEFFLDSLQAMHKDVRTIGVFSCGPPGLTNGVDEACTNLNKFNKARFNHFYENF